MLTKNRNNLLIIVLLTFVFNIDHGYSQLVNSSEGINKYFCYKEFEKIISLDNNFLSMISFNHTKQRDKRNRGLMFSLINNHKSPLLVLRKMPFSLSESLSEEEIGETLYFGIKYNIFCKDGPIGVDKFIEKYSQYKREIDLLRNQKRRGIVVRLREIANNLKIFKNKLSHNLLQELTNENIIADNRIEKSNELIGELINLKMKINEELDSVKRGLFSLEDSQFQLTWNNIIQTFAKVSLQSTTDEYSRLIKLLMSLQTYIDKSNVSLNKKIIFNNLISSLKNNEIDDNNFSKLFQRIEEDESLNVEIRRLEQKNTKEEFELLNRPNGKIFWKKISANNIVAGTFNPLFGRVEWVRANKNEGIGYAYNPKLGYSEKIHIKEPIPILSFFNVNDSLMEWKKGNLNFGQIYCPHHKRIFSTSVPAVGVYIPPCTKEEVGELSTQREIIKKLYQQKNNLGPFISGLRERLVPITKSFNSLMNWEKEGFEQIVQNHSTILNQAYNKIYEDFLKEQLVINEKQKHLNSLHQEIIVSESEKCDKPQHVKLLSSAQRAMAQDLINLSCSICFEKMDCGDILTMPCGGTFCQNCLQEYTTININSGQVPLKCPQYKCGHHLSSKKLGPIILKKDPELQNKWIIKELENNWFSTHRLNCPRINCSGGKVKEHLHDKNERCGLCRSCLKCGKTHPPINDETNCERSIGLRDANIGFRDLIKKSDFRFCPHCNAITERIDGCNNINCTVCKKDWYWNHAHSKPSILQNYHTFEKMENGTSEKEYEKFYEGQADQEANDF